MPGKKRRMSIPRWLTPSTLFTTGMFLTEYGRAFDFDECVRILNHGRYSKMP
jgi:hypothetical protein